MSEQNEPSALELHGQILAISEQRNEALDKFAIANGRLGVAGQTIMALKSEVAQLREKLDAATKKKLPARKRRAGKAKA